MLPLRLLLGALNSVFNPLQLFQPGVSGAWYDPNDLATLFQDTAGATPVSAVNQSVARMTDKSGLGYHVTQATAGLRPVLRGTPAGANLVTNPYFYSGTGWTFGMGWAAAKPAAQGSAVATTLGFNLAAVVGKVYLVKYTVHGLTSGSIVVGFGGVSLPSVTANGSCCRIVTATSTAVLTITGTLFSGYVRNISIQDISAGQCGTPYYLDFDGADDCLTGTAMVTAYPATMLSRHYSDDQIAGSLSTLALYQDFTDNKQLRSQAGALDWKEATSAATAPGATGISFVMRADLATGSNKSVNGVIPAAAVAHSNTWGTKTSVFVGKGRVNDSYFRGRLYSGLITNTTLSAADVNSVYQHFGSTSAIEAWGDSLTAGLAAGTLVLGGWVVRASGELEIRVGNNGGSGQSSTQIKDRFIASTSDTKKLTQIFWMGTNNAVAPATVAADFATCVAALNGHTRYIVISPQRSDGNALGAQAYYDIESSMESIYGARYLNLRLALVAHSDGSANDTADIAAGLTPRSTRIPADSIHLNDFGHQICCTAIINKLRTLGYV